MVIYDKRGPATMEELNYNRVMSTLGPLVTEWTKSLPNRRAAPEHFLEDFIYWAARKLEEQHA